MALWSLNKTKNIQENGKKKIKVKKNRQFFYDILFKWFEILNGRYWCEIPYISPLKINTKIYQLQNAIA